MASIVRFTPLYGAKSSVLALSGVLELDNYKILLDCGWDVRFNLDTVEPLRAIAPQIDAVLLSHPDVMHLGALPYAVGKLGLNVPVFATLPVWRMGQMFMYDAVLAKKEQEDFNEFDLDDVDNAFERITQLKFQQPFALTGKGDGIVITPYSAGHMLGGTVWKVKKETEEMKDTEEVIYAVDVNHRKERHLNPSALLSISRPSHLILGASQSLTRITPKLDLTGPAIQALERGGNVLVPVDTAGRVVEVALLFDDVWSQKKITQYPVAILDFVAFNTFDFAQSMIEWMSDSVSSRFDLLRENPFQFKHVHLCHTKAEVDALPSPKVVLASFPTMEIGFSLEYFLEWAEDPKNLVLLVDRVEKGTLAHELKSLQGPMRLVRTRKKRVPLEGAELREWREAQRQKELEAARNQEGTASQPDAMDTEANPQPMDSEASQDEEDDGFDSLKKQNFVMFPYQETERKWDDYGEIVDPEQFRKGEDAAELDEDDMGEDEPKDLTIRTNFAMEGVTDSEEEERRKIPKKYVEEQVDIVVRCETVTRDFSGLCDGISLKELISAVAPRRLIIVHGTEEETRAVVDMGINGLGLSPDSVFAPSKKETVDVTSDTSVYRLKLADSLFNSLRFRKIADGEVAFVHGRIRIEESEDREDVILESVPEGSSSGHPTVFVGDARLPILKQSLRQSDSGFKPEIAAGVLYTENQDSGAVVTIKKQGVGDFDLQANLSEDYFAFRDHLYTHFVTL
uniref:Cleavage and polyadenylation specificity factor subunit 2 n=1 Tax=Rhodosorus marinus TaxID=101924 RepID=A0A7S3EJW3_9RHOD|mmetsp:Transcript_42033/g.164654  ORF Transcript_42033/g.164654 Transcript_42033/m.164654 type:complete len:739 (+) Transcript_42033:57-2273(+)